MEDFHSLFTLVVLAGITAAMIWERLGPDIVMFCGLSLLVVGGVVEPDKALLGFGRPETITIAV